MAKKKPAPAVDTDNVEVVSELYPADDEIEYEDVTGKDTLPEGVSDEPDEEDDEPAPKKKKVEDEGEEDEEFSGKSKADILKMYRDAQKLIGRQGSELGDLRRTHDDFIRKQLAQQTRQQPKKPQEEEVDIDDAEILTNPKGALAKLIENHPTVRELRGQARENAAREIMRSRQEAVQKFSERHPDAKEVWDDPDFREWVDKSPNRQRMLIHAHRNYDLGVADDLFSTYKELKALRNPKVVASPGKGQPRPVATREQARVPTGGNAGPKSSGTGKKPFFRRADIIRMMENEPERYAMMADEITQAYTEGRVK